MSRIARNSVNGWLNRNTFCSGTEVAPVQCKRGLNLLHSMHRLVTAFKSSYTEFDSDNIPSLSAKILASA